MPAVGGVRVYIAPRFSNWYKLWNGRKYKYLCKRLPTIPVGEVVKIGDCLHMDRETWLRGYSYFMKEMQEHITRSLEEHGYTNN